MDQPITVTGNRTQDTEVFIFINFIMIINVITKPTTAGHTTKFLANNETRNEAQVATIVEITMAIATISIPVAKNTD